jgi:hypothetical protein
MVLVIVFEATGGIAFQSPPERAIEIDQRPLIIAFAPRRAAVAAENRLRSVSSTSR